MANFIYSVWFRDILVPKTDQDHKWVACIGIEAPIDDEAHRWGDILAHGRCERHPNDVFLFSSIESESSLSDVTDWQDLPHIKVGEMLSDDEIGW